MIIHVNSKNELIERIDANYTELNNKELKLYNPLITNIDNSYRLKNLYLRTNCSLNDLLLRFFPQETLSIWSLPKVINELSNSELPFWDYEICFFRQLLKPLATLSMALLGCYFFRFNNKKKSITKEKIFTIPISIFVYFILEISLRVLTYNDSNICFFTTNFNNNIDY